MPETRYTLRINNQSGTLQYIATDFIRLEYSRVVNAPGLAVFSVGDTHPLAGVLIRDWQVEIWRERSADDNNTNAIAAYADFYGFVRDEIRTTGADGQTIVTYYAVGQMHLLQRSIVAYATDVTNRTKFVNTPAETIAKALVTRNATASGRTTDGRDRDVPTWGNYVSVQADGALGEPLDVFCARRNLLEVLQEIARVGFGDFDLIKTGGRTWEFRWYDLQRGTDRSTTVKFSMQYGNMAEAQLRRRWIDELTVAIVAGQGTETSRTIAVRTGVNYNASVNSLEVLVDARDVTTTAGLNARGDARLRETRAVDELRFSILQTPGSLYGLHYFFGDIVTGYYQGVTAAKKIVGVTIRVDPDGSETINIDLENIPGVAGAIEDP